FRFACSTYIISTFMHSIPHIPLARKARGLLFLATVLFRAGTSCADQSLPLDPGDSSFHFTGYSFLHDFHGEAKAISGNAVVNLSANPPVQTAKLAFKTAELTTYNGERDDNMKEWLRVEVHPEVDFGLEK